MYTHDKRGYIASPVPGPMSQILLKTAENVSINHGNFGTVVCIVPALLRPLYPC